MSTRPRGRSAPRPKFILAAEMSTIVYEPKFFFFKLIVIFLFHCELNSYFRFRPEASVVDDGRQAKINFGFNLNWEIVTQQNFLVNFATYSKIMKKYLYNIYLINFGRAAERPQGLVDISSF